MARTEQSTRHFLLRLGPFRGVDFGPTRVVRRLTTGGMEFVESTNPFRSVVLLVGWLVTGEGAPK